MIIASGVAALPTMVTKKEEAINKVAYQADLVLKKRLVKRKSETGRIELEARHEGNEVHIIIRDDGKGLNKEKILQKPKVT